MQPAYNLDFLRRQVFPIAQQLIYLNHASVAPVPAPARQAMQAVEDRLASDPQSLYALSPGDPLGDIAANFPADVARLLHAADGREIVSVPNTSTGLNLVAQAIEWQPGDNIIFSDMEFPSNVYPWMVLQRFGVECRLAPSPTGGLTLEAVEALADSRTRLVTVSAIQFLTGHRADLAALGAFCRAHGILFAVDAIQAAGHMPIDVQAMQIDILSSGGQKSLMGPPGQGFLYVRDAVARTLHPGIIGPLSVEGWQDWLCYDLTPRESALRFTMGTHSLSGMAGLSASIHFLCSIGIEHIDSWTRHLAQVAAEDLTARGYAVITPSDPAQHGPILTFRVGDPNHPKEADAQADVMVSRLDENRIKVSKRWDAHHIPHVRISTHCYNTEDEVRQIGAVLGDCRS